MADRRTRWGIVLLAVGAGVVVAFQVGKIPASMPALRQDLGLSLFLAGWVVSMFTAVACITGLAAGALADLVGARRIVLIGLLLVAAASLGGAFATGPWTILLSRFLEGAGAIAAFVAVPVLILRAVNPRDLRLAFGVWGGYMPAGIALMVVLTPPLAQPMGWRGVWIANAVLLVIFAALFLLGTRSIADRDGEARPRLRAGEVRSDIRDVLRAPGPWLLSLCFATYTANFLAVTAFLPTFFIEQRGYTPGLAATLTAVMIASNILGNLTAGWLLHRGAPRWLPIAIASAVMGLTSIGIYAPGTGDVVRYGLCLLFAMTGGMLPASILGGAPVHAPRSALVGTTNGLVMQWANIGQFVGPPAFAAVAAAHGWASAPWLVLASAGAGILLALMIGRLEARQSRFQSG